MQVSLEKSQPSPKPKKILIRSFNPARQAMNPEHQENSYILKYSPKYYKSLVTELKPSNPLVSKIKKIKKLEKFEGRIEVPCKQIFLKRLWSNLLVNNRKEIEEIPQFLYNSSKVKPSMSFLKRLDVQRMKLFPNLKRILLSKWRANGYDSLVSISKVFVDYISNLRKLRSLEISVLPFNYQQAVWIFKRLDGMSGLFERLKTLTINISNQFKSVKELFENKNLFSHVTDLSFSAPFDPAFAEIPRLWKNLNSLSFEFPLGINQRPEFLSMLTSIQHLDKLKSLHFTWPVGSKGFWGYFKPQPSLRWLIISFNASDLVNEGLFGKNIEAKDVVAHWEDIQELDALHLHVSCNKTGHVIFVKQFITMILKKIRKVRSLKYWMRGEAVCVEPFLVEEVPHLYESLERFQYDISNWSENPGLAKFDLKIMKPFRNLKTLNLEGQQATYENVEEVVSALERNQEAYDETPALKIRIKKVLVNEGWLGETLKSIASVKRVDSSLEMLIDLEFVTEHPLKLLEELCQEIQAVKKIEGLLISLKMIVERDAPLAGMIELLKESHGVHNLKLMAHNTRETIKYQKLDGKKEEFMITN